jgi:hypothetical protein
LPFCHPPVQDSQLHSEGNDLCIYRYRSLRHNSQANIPPPVIGAIVINSVIIITAIILELFLKNRSLSPLTIVFNKPELLHPGLRTQLLEELSAQTGQKIVKVIIRKIDLNKGNVELEGYYRDNANN